MTSHSNDFYENTKKRSAIIRNNRNYLLENIQPSDEIIDSLLSLKYMTDSQRQFIQRQHSKRDKNAELLYVMRSFDEIKFSNFIKCLRQTNQKTVARVMENGGGVIKVEVQSHGGNSTASVQSQLLHQRISDLRNRTKPRLHQTDKLISQLKDEGIEILNSQLDRQTVVVWIWCHSQAASEYIQRLYDSNQLKDILFENIQPSTLEIIESKMLNIDSSEFEKTIVACPTFVNFIDRIDIGNFEAVWGVTKLRNKIYVLCRSIRSSYPTEIRVFEDRNSFGLQRQIEIKEIKYPRDIRSYEKENCLYVSDYGMNCVWKITRETNNQHKIVNWLTTDLEPSNLSVSIDGQLLIVSKSPSILKIYQPDGKCIRSIRLPKDIVEPRHAAETSIGNFIIIHECMEKEEKEEDEDKGSWSSGRKKVTKCVVSELTRDGQMVIRRFLPSNESQKLNDPFYLTLDSDDRVFLADRENQRAVLLDSDLKWNRILCPAKEDVEETMIRWPQRLFYDEERKQLIVGGRDFYLREAINIYTLSRI